MTPEQERRALTFLNRYQPAFLHGGAILVAAGLLGYALTDSNAWWIAVVGGAFCIGMSWWRPQNER